MAEIGHVYAEETTQQTTTSTSYVSALTIDAGDLTDGDKYYCHVVADFGNSGASNYTYTQVKHGSSALSTSIQTRNPEDNGTDKKHIYRWQGLITAVSGDDVEVQFKTSSGTAYLDNICVLLINLEGLTEGSDSTAGDYRFVSQGMTDLSDHLFADHASTTVKHSGSGDEDWLVIGHGHQRYPDETDWSFWFGLSDGSSQLPQYSRSYQNYTDSFSVCLERIYTISSDTDFAFIAREESGVEYSAQASSSIFCLNLDVFASHSKSHSFSASTAGDVVAHGADAAFADSSEDYEVAAVTHTAGVAANLWILGGISNYDPSDRHSVYFRLRHGDDDVLPSGATGGEHEYERHTSTSHDRVSLSRSLVYDVPNTSSTDYGFDADCAQGTTGMAYYDPHIYVIPLELYSASVDVELTPGITSISVSRLSPSLETSVDLTSGITSVSVSRLSPSLETNADLASGITSVSVSRLSPSLETSSDVDLAPGITSISVSRLSPSLETNANLTSGVTSVVVDGLEPDLDVDESFKEGEFKEWKLQGLSRTWRPAGRRGWRP